MIYSLTGKVLKKSLDRVVLSCAGVGYLVQTPASVAGALPGVGGEGTLYTVMTVTENGINTTLESFQYKVIVISLFVLGN